MNVGAVDYLTLKAPEKSQLYGLYVYYVVHICDFGMLRVKGVTFTPQNFLVQLNLKYSGTSL